MTLLTPNTLRKVTYQAVQLAFDADITLFTCYQNFLPSFSTYITLILMGITQFCFRNNYEIDSYS